MLQNAGPHIDTCLLEQFDSTPAMLWIGIKGANHHLPDTCLHDRGSARPGSPRGRTGFERYIKGGAFRHWLVETAKAFYFGMGTPRALVMTPRNNLPANHEDCPDRGIGACLPETKACFSQSRANKKLVVTSFGHRMRYLASGMQANGLVVLQDVATFN